MTARKTSTARRHPLRRVGEPDHEEMTGFSVGSLTNLFAIPIVTGLIVMGGFYYVTNDKLVTYGDAIKNINVKIGDKSAADDKARNDLRDKFIDAQMKTVDGINNLNTRLVAAEINQKTANDQLGKISDSLQKILTFQPPPSTSKKYQ